MLGKKQGAYTIDDYYALSDDRRAELIDGVIYDMGGADPQTPGDHRLYAHNVF